MSEGQIRILIVEDDEITLGILREFLRGKGYDVLTAVTGEEGMQILDRDTPDILLIDMHLPDVNGLQLLNHIRSNPRHLRRPVVLMSMDHSDDLTMEALDRGATEFVNKPLRHDELEIRLRHIMAQQARLVESNSLRLYRVTLSQAFSDDVVARLKDESAAAHLNGEKLSATVLLANLHGLTSRIMASQPESIAQVLNEISSTIMEVVFQHQGSVNKFLGDSFLVAFGYPFSTGADPRNAVSCALEIVDRVRRLQARYAKEVGNELRMCAGVSTGDLFAGFVGGFRRKEYVIIGPAVRMAGVLERVSLRSRFSVLVDEATAAEAGSDFEKVKVNVRTRNGSWPAYGVSGRRVLPADVC